MKYHLKNQKQYYICPKCFDIYGVKANSTFEVLSLTNSNNDDYSIMHTNPCAIWCRKCKEYTFRCDKNMINIVISLLKNNIKTKFCCSGHINMDYIDGHYVLSKIGNAYIYFANEKQIKELYTQYINNHHLIYWYLDGDCLRLKKKLIPKFKGDINKYKKKFKKYRKNYMNELNKFVKEIIDI